MTTILFLTKESIAGWAELVSLAHSPEAVTIQRLTTSTESHSINNSP